MYRLFVLIAAAMLLAACAGTGAGPASPSGPRTIEVTMQDTLTYDPEEFHVTAGETVRFELHNAGQVVHEFYIGDEDAQKHHEDEMREGGMAHDDPDGISVEPGATGTLDYTFAEAGELLVGCHEPGHYAGGMIATIKVEAP